MSQKVIIEYEVTAGGALQEIKRVDRAVDKSGNTAETASSKFAKIGVALAGMAAAYAGVKIKDFLTDSVKAAGDQEKIFSNLQTLIENTGVAWNKASTPLLQYFANLQKLTQYGDTDSAQALSKLIVGTHDLDTAIKLLQPTMDLAVGADKNLNIVAEAVAKAIAGNIGALSRYGLVLDDNTKKQLKNASIQERAIILTNTIEHSYKNAAQTMGGVFSVELQKISNYYGDLKEAIGYVIISLTNQKGSVNGVISVITSLIEFVRNFGAELILLANSHPLDDLVISLLGNLNKILKAISGTIDAVGELGYALAHMGSTTGYKHITLFKTLEGDIDDYLTFLKTRGQHAIIVTAKWLYDFDHMLLSARKQRSGVGSPTGGTSGGTIFAAISKDALDATGNLKDMGKEFKALSPALEDVGMHFEGITKNVLDLQERKSIITDYVTNMGQLGDKTLTIQQQLAKLNNFMNVLRVNLRALNSAISALAGPFTNALTGMVTDSYDSLKSVWSDLWRSMASIMGTIIHEQLQKLLKTVVSKLVKSTGDAAKDAGNQAEVMSKVTAGAAGLAGIYGAYQQGGTMGALSGAISGAVAGFAIGGPLGAAIGGAVGLLAGIFGGKKDEHNKEIWTNWKYSPGSGVDYRAWENVPEDFSIQDFQRKSWQVMRTVHAGFLDAITKMGDSALFQFAKLGEISWGDQSIKVNGFKTILEELINGWIPGQIQNQVAGAFYKGLGNLGASQSWIDKMFKQAGTLDADKRVEFVANMVSALVDITNSINNLDWDKLNSDAVTNSMEAFSTGFDDLLNQIDVYNARMDVELDMEAKAKDVEQIAKLAEQARKAEIQMLRQIDQLQKGINRSIDAQIEGLKVGGMSDTAKIGYYTKKYTSLMSDLRKATSPEDIQRIIQDIQDTLSNLTGAYGDNLYGSSGFASPWGATPAAAITKMLEDAKAVSNALLEGMKDKIKEKNDALLDAIGATKDDFLGLDTNTQALGTTAQQTADNLGNLADNANRAAEALGRIADSGGHEWHGVLDEGSPRVGTGVYRGMPGEDPLRTYLEMILAEIAQNMLSPELAIR